MNEQSAISLMKTSNTVYDWNVNRAIVLDAIDDEVPTWFYAKIDGSGLIKKTVTPVIREKNVR